MSDSHTNYLTDEATVEKIYGLLKVGNISAAVDHLKGLGDDKTVVQTWIGVQCDINNVKGDSYLSETIARPGVEYAVEKGFKKGAAILLHNLSSFHMPNFDEGVDPKVVPGVIEASRRQVELREQLDDKGSLGWAYWDHGMAQLAGGHANEAVIFFEKAASTALANGDRDAEAWGKFFIGKVWMKHDQARREAGMEMMKECAKTISEVGEDWEKDEIEKMMRKAGL